MKRTRSPDTILKKQPRNQCIRESFNVSTLLEVFIPRKNTIPSGSANTTTTESSRPNLLIVLYYTSAHDHICTRPP